MNPKWKVVGSIAGAAVMYTMFAACSSTNDASPASAAEQEISDAIQGHPSARVRAANDALVAALSPEELDHIQQIDWGKATWNSVIADDVFLKAIEAVLPVLDVPASSTPAPLSTSLSTIAPANVHPSDQGGCTPNCPECRRYFENAINVLHQLLQDNADKGQTCGANPFCTAAVFVRYAQLEGYLAFATGCLLVANYTPSQSRSVVGMLSACGPKKCVQPGQPGAEWIACFNACNTEHQCCDIKANPPKCNGGNLKISCKGECNPPAGAPSVQCYGGQCRDKCLGSCSAAIDSFGHCAGVCTGACTGRCAATPDKAVECDGVCDADFDPLCCDGGGQMVWGCAADAACASACVPKGLCH